MPELVFGSIALAAFVLALWLGRPVPTTAPPPAVATRSGLQLGLAATRTGLWSRIQAAWSGDSSADKRLLGLEEALLAADVGVTATSTLLAHVKTRVGGGEDLSVLRSCLRDEMIRLVSAPKDERPQAKPHVIMMVGVNGVGKTTTIAKLARYHLAQGRKVLLVAADTFRAAAVEQLSLWAERLGIECVRHAGGSDPSAVAFDGMRAGVARGVDVIIVDTAGRLHVKANLMNEITKVARIMGREISGAPHEVLLVIDATTGQNAIFQARAFKEVLPLTGVVLTKLDGSAKGGSVLSIPTELGVPIRFAGFGEKPEDLAVFDPVSFVDAILPQSSAAG